MTSVLMVGGGKGGVGKSTVAAGIARTLARQGYKVGVVDADLAGPSQSILFQCPPMYATGGKPVPSLSNDGIRISSVGLIARSDTALVWSDGSAAAAVKTLVDPLVWEHEDCLIIDLPPGQGKVTFELANLFPRALGVLVTTGSALALEECQRAAKFLQRMELTLIGIIENMAHLDCATCGAETSIYESTETRRVAKSLGVDLLAQLPYSADVVQGNRELDPIVDKVLQSWREEKEIN